MSTVPQGTVSLLFSDIEGSTALLRRLGSKYSDVLDAYRDLLRRAWARGDGTEIDTEGDGFFVVFPTAQGAVVAAAAVQRGLAEHAWPNGLQVHVRIGIHTGTPEVHGGGYVGIDVHRAARITGAAHGGQVVVSAATAQLVVGCLPDGVALRDLGKHRLKDLPLTEHLFQLTIHGLPGNFPPLRSLGTASSLPVPATPLVGRDGELAELTGLLRSPGVRLVTLTGPGGSGKTRLAVGMASSLVESFPDGVYFVPLAAVTTPEVMWSTIAEAVDIPAEGRAPPGFFTHVAHRSALFVLDNLEQLPGADRVVSKLLTGAPAVVVIATSRRRLYVAGEHEHPVPALEVPEHPGVAQAALSGAVQLFVQQARMVRPGFAVTVENVGAVVEVCRRLDGLPLAIELAAARSKLLSPTALAARIDQALEFKDTGVDRPTRQQTVRDTIAWSYRLLTPAQQACFRRLGVFAGGADLDAITVVIDPLDEAPLDLVADIVDASLATVIDGSGGEPRIKLLETIRAFALRKLRSSGELDEVRRLHASHYVNLVQRIELWSGKGADVLASRQLFQSENDNLREALSWALGREGIPSQDPALGLRLCAQLHQAWRDGGYYEEGRRLLQAAVGIAGDDDSADLGHCLNGLADLMRLQGDFANAHAVALQSVAMWRRLGDTEGLLSALPRLGSCAELIGDFRYARAVLEEAVMLARDDKSELSEPLRKLAGLETSEGNLERAIELLSAAAVISDELGDELGVLAARHNMACVLGLAGKPEDAEQQMRQQIPRILQLGSREFRTNVPEDYGAVLAELGDYRTAAMLLGAADALRKRSAAPRYGMQEQETRDAFTRARSALPGETWDRQYKRGQDMTVEDALTEARARSRREASKRDVRVTP